VQLTDPAADGATPDARTFQRLDRRLTPGAEAPVAVALSGGGDSVALLLIAARWARARGRRLLALTVDHGLQPESAAWSRFAAEAAAAAGADWRGLTWDGRKPASGLTAAARAARHGLIADAARSAGARVVLFGHTADDIAEADWMRRQGATLGRLREWSPSPAWPEGRGLMLLRPLLAERRAGLRDWLAARGAAWIEDPANADARFGRSRARIALGGAAPLRMQAVEAGQDAVARAWSTPHEGVLRLGRAASARTLAAALVCAGGGATPPRGDRLNALMTRLSEGERFTATLAGARIQADEGAVLVMRETGELRRRPPPPLRLTPGEERTWDGRFAFRTQAAGWTVVPALGLLAALSPQDRARLGRLPAAARGAAPVLIRDDASGPVLADEAVRRRDLVPERLALALDETTHEDDLTRARWRNAVERPIFTDMTFRPEPQGGAPDDRGHS
jgi:tRNA(Ile)-lysidine synthase